MVDGGADDCRGQFPGHFTEQLPPAGLDWTKTYYLTTHKIG